jgi:hypothetical protein
LTITSFSAALQKGLATTKRKCTQKLLRGVVGQNYRLQDIQWSNREFGHLIVWSLIERNQPISGQTIK